MRIVYSSFEGRFSDNPKALFQALIADPARWPEPVEHVWLVDPGHPSDFPPGVTTVPYGGSQCLAALAAADVVVSNTHLDVDWAKQPGCVYLQTWHGTPLKRVHSDVLWAPEGRLAQLTRDVRRWDLLVSPNAASTPRLCGAFGFDGEVAEAGYPRNDLLLSPQRDAVRAQVRAQLGVPEGATAVLYAPTWRDGLFLGGGDEPVRLQLDLASLRDRLGPDVVVLVRMHMLSQRAEQLDHPGVHDVSTHPDINELYLAADVLITDYSSSMVDFAVTGKPLLLFTYDLEHYRDQQRGFYVDLLADPPGPVLRTSDEVVAALADLDAVRRRFAPAYARFRDGYCSLEDGQASARVLDRLLSVRQRRTALVGRRP